MGEWNGDEVIASTIPILILGVPIFDFAYIIIVRLIRGETKTLRQVIEHCVPTIFLIASCGFDFHNVNRYCLSIEMCFVLSVSGLLLRNSESGLDSVVGLMQGGSVVLLIVLLMVTAEDRHSRGYVVTEDTVQLDLNDVIEEKKRVKQTA